MTKVKVAKPGTEIEEKGVKAKNLLNFYSRLNYCVNDWMGKEKFNKEIFILVEVALLSIKSLSFMHHFIE